MKRRNFLGVLSVLVASPLAAGSEENPKHSKWRRVIGGMPKQAIKINGVR